MSHTTSWPPAAPLSGRLLSRLLGELVAAFRRWLARREFERQGRAAALLSERILEDINAPDWLRHEAAAQRNSEKRRLAELRLGIGSIDARHW